MTDVALIAAPPRAQLIEHLRPRLFELVPGWRTVAEGLLGAESRIDFVGVEPPGRIVLILLGEDGDDLELVGRALAQRAWVKARVGDWIQLAPNLGLRPEAGVRAVLLCPEFRPETVAAAAALGTEQVALARYRCLRNATRVEILLEPLSGPTRSSRAPDDETMPPFRTGLTDEDLGLTAQERRELE